MLPWMHRILLPFLQLDLEYLTFSDHCDDASPADLSIAPLR